MSGLLLGIIWLILNEPPPSRERAAYEETHK